MPRQPRAALLFSTIPLLLAGCQRPEDRFTERVARLVRERNPGTSVTVKERFQLQMKGADGGAHDLYLPNLWGECQDPGASCDLAIERYLRLVSQESGATDAYVKPETVRAVLKDREWIEASRGLFQGKPDAKAGNEIVHRPFVADLFVAYVFDMPDGMRVISRDDMGKLKLDADGLHRLAIANLQASLPAITDEPAEPGSAVRVVHVGDSYEASQLLLHERWAAVARRVKGDLVVAAPTRDYVFFTGSRQDVARLRTLARLASSQGGHPLSPTLLRYTQEGWEATP